MKILVYVRQIFGAGFNPVDPVNKCINDQGAWFQHHPKDERAVEQALRLKDAVPGSELTVVGIGPERVEADLRGYLSVGADKAIRIWDDALEDMQLEDCMCATLLEALLRSGEITCDWLLCGDDEMSTVAIHLAELSKRPLATAVSGVASLDGDGEGLLRVKRRLEKSTLTLALSAPAIVAVERGDALRYPKHSDRLRASQQDIGVVALESLGLAAQGLRDKRRLQVDAITSPKPTRKIFPAQGSGSSRVVDLYLGGVGGGGNKQIVEDSVDNMAELVVEKIDRATHGGLSS